MEVEKDKLQFNIPVPLKEWLRKESEKMGLNMSSYIIMVLYKEKEQKEVMGTMGELMQKIENIEKAVESVKE